MKVLDDLCQAIQYLNQHYINNRSSQYASVKYQVDCKSKVLYLIDPETHEKFRITVERVK